MSEFHEKTQAENTESSSASSAEVGLSRRRNPVQRLGCGTALIIWFLLLLTPCFLLTLAVQQEIVITTGSLPGQQFRIYLISEAMQRGVVVSNSRIVGRQSETNSCLETHVRYLLWTGIAESSTYCECFSRTDVANEWIAGMATTGICEE